MIARLQGRSKGRSPGFHIGSLGGLKKLTKRFLAQMIYGIQATKDVKLSNISRSLDEGIALIKNEGRLSRHMGKGDLAEAVPCQVPLLVLPFKVQK